MREVRDAVATLRFMQLSVLDREEPSLNIWGSESPTTPGAPNPNEQGLARVLFYARVFEKGRNRSFVELSDFLHDGTGWRYLQGQQAAASRLKNPEQLDIPKFRALLGSLGKTN